MAIHPRGLALSAKVTALTTGTGPTAGQKAILQKVIDIIDARQGTGNVLENDLYRIRELLESIV